MAGEVHFTSLPCKRTFRWQVESLGIILPDKRTCRWQVKSTLPTLPGKRTFRPQVESLGIILPDKRTCRWQVESTLPHYLARGLLGGRWSPLELFYLTRGLVDGRWSPLYMASEFEFSLCHQPDFICPV